MPLLHNTDPELGCCGILLISVEELSKKTKNRLADETFRAIYDNKMDVEIKVDSEKSRPVSGGTRKIFTRDVAPLCGQTDNTPRGVCEIPKFPTTPDNSSLVWLEHTIDFNVKETINLPSELSFKDNCEKSVDFLNRELENRKRSVWSKINDIFRTRLIGYIGEYKNQTAPINSVTNPLSVNLFNDVALGYNGQSIVQNEFAKIDYTGELVYVGGSYINNAKDAVTGGYNQAGYKAVSLPNAYVDFQLNAPTAFNDTLDHIIVFAPQTFCVLNYTDITKTMSAESILYQRERRKISSGKSPFGDPFAWDVYVDYAPNGCDKQMTLQTWIDVSLPSVYGDNCAKKPILHFLASCAPNPCPTDII